MIEHRNATSAQVQTKTFHTRQHKPIGSSLIHIPALGHVDGHTGQQTTFEEKQEKEERRSRDNVKHRKSPECRPQRTLQYNQGAFILECTLPSVTPWDITTTYSNTTSVPPSPGRKQETILSISYHYEPIHPASVRILSLNHTT